MGFYLNRFFWKENKSSSFRCFYRWIEEISRWLLSTSNPIEFLIFYQKSLLCNGIMIWEGHVRALSNPKFLPLVADCQGLRSLDRWGTTWRYGHGRCNIRVRSIWFGGVAFSTTFLGRLLLGLFPFVLRSSLRWVSIVLRSGGCGCRRERRRDRMPVTWRRKRSYALLLGVFRGLRRCRGRCRGAFQ